MKIKLPPGYVVKEVPKDEFFKDFEKLAPKIFSDNLDYETDDIDSKSTREKIKNLSQQFISSTQYRIHLGVFHKNKLVGWSWGFQHNSFTFYMCNSAVLPTHRRKGIYTFLMQEIIKKVSQAGFTHIYSRHIVTNNEIIILKLRTGFKITSLELSERFGTLVHLTYFPGKMRNEILDFRAGFKRPDQKMKKLFKL